MCVSVCRGPLQLASIALDEMMKQLCSGADIGIFDATNSSKEVRCVGALVRNAALHDLFALQRRAWLAHAVEASAQTLGLKYQCVAAALVTVAAVVPMFTKSMFLCSHRLVFVEIVCTDEKVIAANVRETKLKSPDYKHMEEALAVSGHGHDSVAHCVGSRVVMFARGPAQVEDFLKRIEHYKNAYETLNEGEDVAYIKVSVLQHRQLFSGVLSACTCPLLAAG